MPLSGIDGYLTLLTPLNLHTVPVNRLLTSGLVLLMTCLVGIGLLARHYTKSVVMPLRTISDRFARLNERLCSRKLWLRLGSDSQSEPLSWIEGVE